MDLNVCSQCGLEIEGKGIHFRSRAFCSDECCEEFEAEFAQVGEPGDLELAKDDLDEDLDDGLGYREAVDEDEDILGDDFDIKVEDF